MSNEILTLEQLKTRMSELANEYKQWQIDTGRLKPAPPAPVVGLPAPPQISASVGYKGKNLPDDVRVVKSLLRKYGYALSEDEKYERATQNAIFDFQIKHCRMTSADLRETEQGKKFGWADQLISPNGRTWRILVSGKSLGKVDESQFTAKKPKVEQPIEPIERPSRNLTVTLTTQTIATRIEVWISARERHFEDPIESYHGGKFIFPKIDESLPRWVDKVAIHLLDKDGKNVLGKPKIVEMQYGDFLTIEVKTAPAVVEAFEAEFLAARWKGYEWQKVLAFFTVKVNPVGRIADSIAAHRDIFTGLNKTMAERVFGVATGVVDLISFGNGSIAVKLVFAAKAGIDLAVVGDVMPAEFAGFAKDLASLFSGAGAGESLKKVLLDAIKDYATEKISEKMLEEALGKEQASVVSGFCKLVSTSKKGWKKPEELASNIADIRDAAAKVLDGAGLVKSEENMLEAIQQIKEKYSPKK